MGVVEFEFHTREAILTPGYPQPKVGVEKSFPKWTWELLITQRWGMNYLYAITRLPKYIPFLNFTENS